VSRAWPQVQLGDVLRHRKQFITIDDLTTYRRPRVQLHAQGIVLRDEIPGALIKTKKQQVCREGDFLVAEIDAKVGGYGIVPRALDSAIVSSHYFLFEIDETRLVREYLGYFVRTPMFREQVEAQGSTNYAAIRPSQVLDYAMPLPSLVEQQRIVRWLLNAESRLENVNRLRSAIEHEGRALLLAIVRNGDIAPTLMAELGTLRSPDVSVQADKDYAFAGVYSFGRGVFASQRKRGSDFAYPKLTRVRAGDLVYPKLMAWEGAFGIVPPECDGMVVSPEFPVLELKCDRILSEVVEVHFRDPRVWKAIAEVSTGTNVRRRRLQPTDFLAYMFPLPDRATQMVVRRIDQKLSAARRLAAANERSADALFTSLLASVFTRGFCPAGAASY